MDTYPFIEMEVFNKATGQLLKLKHIEEGGNSSAQWVPVMTFKTDEASYSLVKNTITLTAAQVNAIETNDYIDIETDFAIDIDEDKFPHALFFLNGVLTDEMFSIDSNNDSYGVTSGVNPAHLNVGDKLTLVCYGRYLA